VTEFGLWRIFVAGIGAAVTLAVHDAAERRVYTLEREET